MSNTETSQDTGPNTGLWAGIAAYTMWGLFPIYFKATDSISALEILAHRILWSLPFCLLIIVFRKQLGELIAAFKQPKLVLLLFISSVFLAANWGVYIWAIQQDEIFQGSLGYYINPLMYVLVGVLFLGEKLSKAQGLAVFLAALGVVVLTLYGGVFPAISLFLAASFTVYGVIRKQVVVGSVPGLFIEVAVLFLPALFYVLWLSQNGQFDFLNADTNLKTLLVLAGPITVLPLAAFAFAARRLKLSTLGFLQYIGPTLQFICGLYYGEAFTTAHALCFGFIWLAIAIFSWDAWKNRPKPAV